MKLFIILLKKQITFDIFTSILGGMFVSFYFLMFIIFFKAIITSFYSTLLLIPLIFYFFLIRLAIKSFEKGEKWQAFFFPSLFLLVIFAPVIGFFF